MDNKIFEKPDVKLIAYSQGNFYYDYSKRLGPEELSVFSAATCFEERSSYQIFLNDVHKLDLEKFEKKKEGILEGTSGSGHGSVLDQNRFYFCIENIPRIATLQLCQPQYLEHIQQSLRRAPADRLYFLPKETRQSDMLAKTIAVMDSAFGLYNCMKEAGIPEEDARFILPLYAKTNIQTSGNSRELMHLHDMSRNDQIPSVIKETVEELIGQLNKSFPKLFKERATNYEKLAWYPSAQLFATENKTIENIIVNLSQGPVTLIGTSEIPMNAESIKKAVEERDEAELANLKHLHYTFLAEMSLVSFHQAIRQRTWDQSVESIYHAIERGNFITPLSIQRNEKYHVQYTQQQQKMLDFYHELVQSGIKKQEALGVLPHSLTVYDLIHINGWNAIHSIAKRTCTTAQWEIRAVGRNIAEKLYEANPALGKYGLPQGILYGRCPEKENCGYCDTVLKKTTGLKI